MSNPVLVADRQLFVCLSFAPVCIENTSGKMASVGFANSTAHWEPRWALQKQHLFMP